MQSLTPAEVRAEKRALALRKAADDEKRKSDLWASVRRLLKSPGFQVGLLYMWLALHYCTLGRNLPITGTGQYAGKQHSLAQVLHNPVEYADDVT